MISLLSTLGAMGLTIERIINTPPDSADATFAVLLLINISKCVGIIGLTFFCLFICLFVWFFMFFVFVLFLFVCLPFCRLQQFSLFLIARSGKLGHKTACPNVPYMCKVNNGLNLIKI